MRIAIAQINPVVGDIDGNTRKIVEYSARARDEGAALVAFPELTTIGYPPKDLLLKKSLIQENLDALDLIAAESR
ncbi:MAG: NAD+ synthase, partial [Gemmatimonadota bacterium]|nr:NAD+ synthase [Gemmatimonadota bacterium]